MTRLWAGRCEIPFAVCLSGFIQGVHLAFSSVGFANSFYSVRLPTRACKHSSPSSAGIRKRWAKFYRGLQRDNFTHYTTLREEAVAQLAEVLNYKTEGCGFDSRWCLWNFWLT
jgi:hypothetical protein